MFVSVDLPIPGAPPSSTSEPGTRPPPSTRSSSPIPVDIRASGVAPTSPSRRTSERPEPASPPAPPRPRPRGAGATRSSTSVFQAPQPGHWPRHCAAGGPALRADVDCRGPGHAATKAREPRGRPARALPSARSAARRRSGRRCSAWPGRSCPELLRAPVPVRRVPRKADSLVVVEELMEAVSCPPAAPLSVSLPWAQLKLMIGLPARTVKYLEDSS